MAKPRIPLVIVPFVLLLLGLLGWTVWKQVRPAPGDDTMARMPAMQDSGAGSPLPQGVSPPLASPRSRGPSPAARKILDSYSKKAMDPVQAKQQRDRILAELEAQHRAEPVDAAWSAKTEHALADIAGSEAMAGTGIVARDYAADCRSSTCRISATFDSRSSAEDWGTFFLTGSGQTLRQAKVMVVPGPGGTAEVRVYGVRR